ncbi:hypothetical protein ACTA71_000375 [Dictyostelium dimigraforme]
MKTISILLTIILFLILIINLSNSYKLERYIEEKDWESIETEKENIFKPVIVERRELLFFRFLRNGNSDSSSSTESVSIKFEIHSKDIQETFYLFGLNNETSIRNIKDVELKDRKEETTPIRIEACFDPIKPLYFSLSMFNYLWGGDLLFTIQENNSSYCINSMPNVQKKKIDTSTVLIATDKPQSIDTTAPSSPSPSITDSVTAPLGNKTVENVTVIPTSTQIESVTQSPSVVQQKEIQVTVPPPSNKPEVVSNRQSIETDSTIDKPKIDSTPIISKKQKIEMDSGDSGKQIDNNKNSVLETTPAVSIMPILSETQTPNKN